MKTTRQEEMNVDSQQQKLHPIYVALDGHQYNRAIKLASALPDTNILGKALLAHAYSKNGQRHNALLTLQTILITNRIPQILRDKDSPSASTTLYFCELQHEVESCLQSGQQRRQEQQSPQQQNQQQVQQSSSSKKGKKGKKKPTSNRSNTSNTQQPPVAAAAAKKWDWVDQLNTPPTLPKNWEVQPPAELAITDETTLATISVTLQTLKMPLTAYQLYSWASAANPTRENLLTKTFTLGLSVLASPSKWTYASHVEMSTVVLGHLQAVALQWARLAVSVQQSSKNNNNSSPSPLNRTNDDDGIAGNFAFMLTTAWAAQTALWQLEWLPKDDKRWLILPRLAESMAMRLVSDHIDKKNGTEGADTETVATKPSSTNTSSMAAEIQLLCLRALEIQSKWSDMNELLDVSEKKQRELAAITGTRDQRDDDDDDPEEIITSTMSEFGVAMTQHQILTKRAAVLEEMENYELAQGIYEKLIYTTCPDDWQCWMGFWKCVCRCNSDSAIHMTHQLIENILLGRPHPGENIDGGTQNSAIDLEQSSKAKRKYPLRGPNLMKVEVAAAPIRELQNAREKGEELPVSNEIFQNLISAIQVFAEKFAPRAPCTYTDLSEYIELLLFAALEVKNIEDKDIVQALVESMLEWAAGMLKGSATSSSQSLSSTSDEIAGNTTKERREKLRTHIFAARVTHKILSVYVGLQDRFLPNLKDLVNEWQASLTINSSNEGEEVSSVPLCFMIIFRFT